MASSNEKHWFRPRSYAHFDGPIDKATAIEIATDAGTVRKHAFHPLILIPQTATKRERLVDGSTRFTKKVRPIGYVAHSDAAIQSYYSRLLRDRLEEHYKGTPVDACVLAYQQFPAIAKT